MTEQLPMETAPNLPGRAHDSQTAQNLHLRREGSLIPPCRRILELGESQMGRELPRLDLGTDKAMVPRSLNALGIRAPHAKGGCTLEQRMRSDLGRDVTRRADSTMLRRTHRRLGMEALGGKSRKTRPKESKLFMRGSICNLIIML